METEQLEVRSGDVVLVGDALGDRDGAPVLFLHGGGQTRQSWRRALTEAARCGFRAMAFDLRGHGESGWSPDGAYSSAIFADDIRAIVATLNEPPCLVGASLGGLASLLVAAYPPPPVRALVLVDVSVRIEPEGTREIRDFMHSGLGGFASPEEAADAVAAYQPHRTRPADTSGLLRNLRLRDDGRYHWHWDPAFIAPRDPRQVLDPRRFEEAAAALRVPALLVRGGSSRVVSPAGARAFLDLAPHAELVEVAGAHHMIAGDANDRFNAAVFAFLRRHAPPPGLRRGDG